MQQLGLEAGVPLEKMHVLTREGQDIAGADAVIFLARQIWWTWPAVVFAQLPGMHKLLDGGYRWIAAHRGCDHVACDLKKRRSTPALNTIGDYPSSVVSQLGLGSARDSRAHSGDSPQCSDENVRFGGVAEASTRVACAPQTEDRAWKPPLLEAWPGWMLLIGLPISVLPLRDTIAPWQFMWVMAGAIFFGCKWVTAWRAQKPNADLKLIPTLGYFLAWPGTDAEKFLAAKPSHPRLDCFKQSSLALPFTHMRPAIVKTLLGAVLLFGVAEVAHKPLLVGWIGMIGMILILHFGLFQLLAAEWRKAGIDVEPIMNTPLRSKTVSEFWGRRWNSGFNRLAFEFISRPITRRLGGCGTCDTRRSRRTSALHFGPAIATLTAFLVSGLIHELVISLPAGAGYGLPTAYFLLQGLGILLERVFPQIRGRTFTILITAIPAFWLFHPPFVHNVILPFMKAIGAL